MHIVVSRIQVNARPISTATTFAPKIAKGGYLYTPQIKFGRILNNSRFDRLCTVFLHSRHSAFLQISPISRRAARYQKLSNPPLPLFARSADCTRFLRHVFFQHKSAVLQNCTHFYIFHLFAKNSTFLRTAISRAFLAFLFLYPFFKNRSFFARAKKSGSILTAQKEGGFFILSHQNSALN